jgi:hypothetical protein
VSYEGQSIARLFALQRRLRRRRAVAEKRKEKYTRALTNLKRAENELMKLQQQLETRNIIPLGHPQGGRTSAYHRRLFAARAVAAWLFLLLPVLALAQTKGATALLNLVSAPSAPTSVSVLPTFTAQIAAPAAYSYQARVTVAWSPSPDVVAGYRVYWGMTTNAMTNVVTTVRTNVTFNVPEGAMIYVKARSFDASLTESPDSNQIMTVSGFYTDVVQGTWFVRAKGLQGATNRVQVTTDMKTWTTIGTFVGNGTLRTFARTNTTKEFFRTVSP